MKKIVEYLPLHFVVFLIIGILTEFYLQFWQYGFTKFLLLFASISIVLMCIKNRGITTIISFILFFFVGVSSVYFNNDSNYKNYYQNYLTANSSAFFRISKVLKSNNYNDKYEAEVIQIEHYKTVGKVLLNIQKDSINNTLKVDDFINSKADFIELLPPLNPHQFDYKFYLLKQGIKQQLFLKKYQYKRIDFNTYSLIGFSAKFRSKLQKSLTKYRFKDDELSVINALLLGQRQDVSKELIANYSRAGVIHILAVSGLHVGVILLIFSFLLKPLEKVTYGKFFKMLLIVLFLWMFAFIAGLSASVVRAVTMFTFLAIGQSFQQKRESTFSLIASMFFLLLIKPMFLFDVGFQLSYLAVFGIVWLQPKLYAIWKPKLKSVDYFWQLLTVSIGAQVGILPLSLYYFHQFPSLFLVSNLVIVPCLIYILGGGIIVIFLALFNLLPQFLATIYGAVISLMNNFVSWISNQEQFLLKEISISFSMMIFWYFFTFFGIHFLINKKAKNLLYFLSTFFVFQSVLLFEKKQRNEKQEFVIFHKSRKSILGKKIGDKLFLQHDLDTLNFMDDYSLKPYRVAENCKEIRQTNFKNLINFSNKNILLVDSLGIYKVKGLENPIIVLQYSPKINLKRLIETVKPSLIIADGSNYKSYTNRWKIICKEENILFYDTGKNGAYIIK